MDNDWTRAILHNYYTENFPTVERMGAGRHDPFIAYPITMTSNSKLLLDYSTYKAVSIVFVYGQPLLANTY